MGSRVGAGVGVRVEKVTHAALPSSSSPSHDTHPTLDNALAPGLHPNMSVGKLIFMPEATPSVIHHSIDLVLKGHQGCLQTPNHRLTRGS